RSTRRFPTRSATSTTSRTSRGSSRSRSASPTRSASAATTPAAAFGAGTADADTASRQTQLEKHGVVPDAVALRDPLAAAHDAEPDPLVEAKARLVGGDDRGLDRPNPLGRAARDHAPE